MRPDRVRRRLRAPDDWVDAVRLAAVPFALLEVATEDYGPGEERLAWALALALGVAAVALALAGRRGRPTWLGAVALAFDTAFVSAWAVLYAVEPGTPARELLVLVAVEAGLRYGPWGSLWALATVPALALFERRLSESLGAPFDAGHAVLPAGLYLLVALVVGVLSARRRGESRGRPRERPRSG